MKSGTKVKILQSCGQNLGNEKIVWYTQGEEVVVNEFNEHSIEGLIKARLAIVVSEPEHVRPKLDMSWKRKPRQEEEK